MSARGHARVDVDAVLARPAGGDPGDVGAVPVRVADAGPTPGAPLSGVGASEPPLGLDPARRPVGHEVHARDDAPLQIGVVGDTRVDDRDTDADAGHAIEPERTGPGLVGADRQVADRHRGAHHRVGGQVANVRVPGQGIELPAGHGEHTAPLEVARDLEVVAPGEPIDLHPVAVDNNLDRCVRAGVEPLGQLLRELVSVRRAGVRGGRERERECDAERQRHPGAPGAMPPPPTDEIQGTAAQCAGEHNVPVAFLRRARCPQREV